ncbi:hypothetical protein CWATWH0401_1059 [Crocosphaera watsonii WH 0401]|uniref:Uncharacterized protein n=2 Tax=Crocosphaera watsonii TaxID=263511 RepID=G5J1S0_CROWT|nr:hypothetical protein CWATWH0003_1452 [Crocosphaera watsonii WH 0003]CCQ61828.1 hypothetical protein CWATWH0401_1059 [Crocosphaera watsonii WH 0401]
MGKTLLEPSILMGLTADSGTEPQAANKVEEATAMPQVLPLKIL